MFVTFMLLYSNPSLTNLLFIVTLLYLMLQHQVSTSIVCIHFEPVSIEEVYFIFLNIFLSMIEFPEVYFSVANSVCHFLFTCFGYDLDIVRLSHQLF